MKRLLLVAVAIAALCAVQTVGLDAQAKAKTATASGTVKSVSGTSLTITAAGGKDMTFTVDSSTKFVGKGLGTKAKAGPITATDAVAANDRVRVTYHETGGTNHAASVNIIAKATAKK